MPIHKYRYFAPTDAARMGKLQFMARQVVEGVITGRALYDGRLDLAAALSVAAAA